MQGILGPLFEGAVTEGDWGSVLILMRHSLRQPLRAATSLKEGGKAASPQLPDKLQFYYYLLYQTIALHTTKTAAIAAVSLSKKSSNAGLFLFCMV